MRLPLIAIACACITLGQSAPAGSIRALVAAVRGELQSHAADRDVASIIDRTTLAERLDDAVIEQLQSEGAGAEAVEALDRQHEATRALPKPSQLPHLFDAPLAPAADERLRVIEKAREWALQYSAGLPNFICTQTVHRFTAPKESKALKVRDTLTIDVGYSDKAEQYKLLTIDGKPTTKLLKSLGGFQSSGEFGSLLKQIFTRDAETHFEWERWSNLRGRLVHVFSYRIEKAHSRYRLSYAHTLKRHFTTAGMRGFVYVDRETNQIMRYSDEATDLPDDYPVKRTSAVLDYEYADVAGQRYLLPRHVDLRVISKDNQSRNVMDFGNYRKFSSEATLTFEK
jgi:hypothetical protein